MLTQTTPPPPWKFRSLLPHPNHHDSLRMGGLTQSPHLILILRLVSQIIRQHGLSKGLGGALEHARSPLLQATPLLRGNHVFLRHHWQPCPFHQNGRQARKYHTESEALVPRQRFLEVSREAFPGRWRGFAGGGGGGRGRGVLGRGQELGPPRELVQEVAYLVEGEVHGKREPTPGVAGGGPYCRPRCKTIPPPAGVLEHGGTGGRRSKEQRANGRSRKRLRYTNTIEGENEEPEVIHRNRAVQHRTRSHFSATGQETRRAQDAAQRSNGSIMGASLLATPRASVASSRSIIPPQNIVRNPTPNLPSPSESKNTKRTPLINDTLACPDPRYLSLCPSLLPIQMHPFRFSQILVGTLRQSCVCQLVPALGGSIMGSLKNLLSLPPSLPRSRRAMVP